MDNNPLTYMMSMPNLDAVGHRWVVVVVGFNFTIEYLRGSDKKVADCCIVSVLKGGTPLEVIFQPSGYPS